MSGYTVHEKITKEVLDSVEVGDLVKFQDWRAPYRVKGVSENYFVAARKIGHGVSYTICEKKPWPGVRHNAMRGGMFHIGPDHWIFGWIGWENGYDFDDKEAVERYLQSLETGETAISERKGCPILLIAIKKGNLPRAGT